MTGVSFWHSMSPPSRISPLKPPFLFLPVLVQMSPISNIRCHIVPGYPVSRSSAPSLCVPTLRFNLILAPNLSEIVSVICLFLHCLCPCSTHRHTHALAFRHAHTHTHTHTHTQMHTHLHAQAQIQHAGVHTSTCAHPRTHVLSNTNLLLLAG